jgi:NAD(P)-dependent dehydrogenase (short-subunit alcohol dehydrogenase family)
MGKLDGKVAIVTGAARGLGRAYAKRLAGLGAKVAVADLNLRSTVGPFLPHPRQTQRGRTGEPREQSGIRAHVGPNSLASSTRYRCARASRIA